MLFGLTSTPTTFIFLMNKTFQMHFNQFVTVFIDDILIYSSSWKEHEKHIQIVLQILQEKQLYAKFSKCKFQMEEITFIGYIVSKEEVQPDPSKIKAILEWQALKSVTWIRSFLDLARCYRRFVKNFSVIFKPLMTLLKKNTSYQQN